MILTCPTVDQLSHGPKVWMEGIHRAKESG